MTRALETRLVKLETRAGINDADLSRLPEAELNARIEAMLARLIAQHGGTLEATIEALRSDPVSRIIVAELERRLAAQSEAA